MTSGVTPDGPGLLERTTSLMAERLEQLERDNRRLRRYGGMMLVGLACLLGLTIALFLYSGRLGLGGAVPENIAARQFTIRDPRGTVRGSWGLGGDGTVRLLLSDAAGRPRVRLSLLPDGSSGLSLADSANRKMVAVGVLPDLTSSFVMSDRSGLPRAVLGVSNDGSSNIVFADRGGAMKAGLGVDSRGIGAIDLPQRGGAVEAPDAPFDESDEADSTEAPAQAPSKAPSRRR